MARARYQLLFGDKTEKRGGSEPAKAEKPVQTGHGPRSQPLLPELEQVHLVDPRTRSAASAAATEVFQGQHVDVKYVLKKHLRQKYRCRSKQARK